MTEKKNNHYIPRLILKHWVTTINDKREGVYVFDTIKNKSYFSESKGKKGFSFAMVKDLYVPTIDKKRRLDLEDWFCGIETILDKTIRKLNLKEPGILFTSPTEMMKFILALFSFKHRTKYVIEKHTEYLDQNHDKIKLISGRNDENKDLILLENIVNATTNDATMLSNFEMIVMRSKGNSLIYGDMPFLEELIDGFNFLPLTNKIFIAFRPTGSKSFYKFNECDDKMIDSLNFAIASNSRYWIAADNSGQIKKYEKELKNNENKEPFITPIKFPMSGSTF